MHFTELPKVGDQASGTVVQSGVAVGATDEEGNEVTKVQVVIELDAALDTVAEHPQEPAGGVEPHAGEPEPKVTSNDNPNRDAELARLKQESSARAAAKVKEQQTHADQSEVNEAGDAAAKGVDKKAAGAKADGNPKTTTDKK